MVKEARFHYIKYAWPMKMESVTAIVLAGGRGRRMGGRDKGLVELCGKPLAQWVTESLVAQLDGAAESIVVSANRNLSNYAKLGWWVVSDSMSDFQGPLAGILACAKQVTSQFVLVAAADAPVLPSDYLATLYQGLSGAAADLAVASVDGHIQPTHMLFRRILLGDLEEWLRQGNRKVQDWISRQSHVVVEFSSDNMAFRNINDQQALEELSKYLCP